MFDLIKRNRLVSYFILTFAISWTIWSPIVASAQGWTDWDVPYALYYFGSFGPAIAAFIITALTQGGSGIRDLATRNFKWRLEFRYYAVAVLTPIGLFVLAYLLNRLVAGEWSDLRLLGKADYLPHLGPFVVLGLWFLTYGFGEETGWRGFALPHLQKNRSAITNGFLERARTAGTGPAARVAERMVANGGRARAGTGRSAARLGLLA